jgi:hypothetical protein
MSAIESSIVCQGLLTVAITASVARTAAVFLLSQDEKD